MLNILLSMALIAAPASLSAGEGFTFRDGEPLAGSNIRPSRLVSQLPFDKKYEQLSAGERETLRANYESMSAKCEPPFPEAGLRPVFRQLVQHQDKRRIDPRGRLSLLVKVGADGEAKEIAALESPSPELSQIGGAILLNTRFKPARCEGQAVAMDYLMEVEVLSLATQGVSARSLVMERD